VSEKRINIESAFQKLSDIAGFEGIVFVSTQGSVLAAKFVEGTTSPKAADSLAACLKDLDSLIKKISPSNLEEMSVKGKLRTVVILKSRAIGFLTAVVGLETMHLGLARLKTRETIEELEKTLDQIMTKRPQE